jgi:hydroxymethylglutaryl-CoA reductase
MVMLMTKWTANLYRRSLPERQKLVAKERQLTPDQLATMQGQSDEQHNELIENYVMDYLVPEGVAVNLMVNNRQYVVPMATEEPSVVAAACNGAKRISASGGFQAPTQSRLVTGQVVVTGVKEPTDFKKWCQERQQTLLDVANAAHPSMKKRGAGAKQIRVRHNGKFMSLDVVVDVDQAMGANSVNTMAEAVGHYCQAHGWQVLAAILSNYATDALQTVHCFVSNDQLATQAMPGKMVAQRIHELSELAQVDQYRAVTHNKGIMNGVDAVVLASGNDWRAVEAGAHAYAVHDGQYRGLSQWQLVDGGLKGTLTLPMTVGVVGGSIKLTQQSKINYQINQVQSAQELSAVATSVGLAQNLAALRALTTSGIQAGHMKLQYRSLALSVGATGEEISQLVARLERATQVDTTVATQLLAQLRKEEHDAGKI